MKKDFLENFDSIITNGCNIKYLEKIIRTGFKKRISQNQKIKKKNNSKLKI